MRNLFLLSLLATTALAMPAQAQDRRWGERPDRGDRSEQSERGDRSDRRSRSERRSNDDSSQSEPQQERERPVMRERSVDAPSFGTSGGDRGNRGIDRPRTQDAGDSVRRWRQGVDGGTSPQTQATGDSVRDWRGPSRRRGGTAIVDNMPVAVAPTEPAIDTRTIEERNLRRVGGGGTFDRNVRTTPGFGGDRVRRIGRNVPVEGTAPPPVTREEARLGTTSHRWRGDWRGDRRYDWRRYRDRNRSIFRIGFYYDPFGWNYRRYNVGWRLWPSYYSQNYWLNDPWQYRLPPAYGPFRWVRYHDDALLVNIYTGQVEDVIYNFFW